MAAPVPNVPWEYLREASRPSLENFELSRLNHANNLRKEIVLLMDEWLEETAAAMLAQWLRQNRHSVKTALERPPSLPAAVEALEEIRKPLPPAVTARRRRARTAE